MYGPGKNARYIESFKWERLIRKGFGERLRNAPVIYTQHIQNRRMKI